MQTVYKSQLIELIVPAGSLTTKLQFPDQPYLRNKQILGIETVIAGDMDASPSNRVPISLNDFQKSYLTLYLNDVTVPNAVGEWIQNVPFVLLHRIQNATPDPYVRTPYTLAGQVIYWEKCFVSFASALNPITDVSILLNVYFKG
jgi:hypothetical protein